MDFSIIITLAAAISAGVAVTCCSLMIFHFMEGLEIDRDSGDEGRKSLPVMIKAMMPLAPNLRFIARFKLLQPALHHTEDHLLMSGYSSAISAVDFIAVRALLTLLGILFWLLCIMSGKTLIGLALVACLYIYPGAWLKTIVKKRHLEIMKALPNVLDLLTLSVEAGKDFLTSLRDILGRRKMDALGEELGRTFKEIQLGKKRRQALRDLSFRVKQPDLTAVLNAIIQADELGVSIGNLLKIQGDMLRTKRFNRAEKLANEAPVKILFPMVVFIFPAVILVLMAPILLQAFNFLMH